MAFTGTGVNASYGTRQVRITGLSLASGATGTIGNNGSGADHELPTNFPTLAVNVKAHVNYEAPNAGIEMGITKAAGPPVLVNLRNHDGVNATGNLEIILEMPHSIPS